MENKTSIFILWVLSKSLGIKKLLSLRPSERNVLTAEGKLQISASERCWVSAPVAGAIFMLAAWEHGQLGIPGLKNKKPRVGDMQKVTTRKHRLFSHSRVTSYTSPPILKSCDKIVLVQGSAEQKAPRDFLLFQWGQGCSLSSASVCRI